MLKKLQKLNTKEHILTLKNGKRSFSKHFQIQVFNLNTEITKCAVVVPKKLYKKAHERNLYRRKLAHLVSNIYPQLLPGKSIIVSLKEPIENISFNELQLELKELLAS